MVPWPPARSRRVSRAASAAWTCLQGKLPSILPDNVTRTRNPGKVARLLLLASSHTLRHTLVRHRYHQHQFRSLTKFSLILTYLQQRDLLYRSCQVTDERHSHARSSRPDLPSIHRHPGRHHLSQSPVHVKSDDNVGLGSSARAAG